MGDAFGAALPKDHGIIIIPDQVQTLMFNTCIAQLNKCDFYTILKLSMQSESLQQTFCRLKSHTTALVCFGKELSNTQLLIFAQKMGKTISKGCSNLLRVMESSACYTGLDVLCSFFHLGICPAPEFSVTPMSEAVL